VQLRPDVHRELTAALLDAFPSNESLSPVIRDLGQRSAQVLPQRANLSDCFDALISWAESHDRVVDLVVAAREQNRTNVKLQQFAQRYFHDPLTSDIPEGGPVPPPKPRCSWVLFAVGCLLGAGVVAGYWWWDRSARRAATDFQRVLDRVTSHDPEDPAAAEAWGDKPDLTRRWLELAGKEKEEGFRVLRLGPWKQNLGERAIQVLFGCACKVRFQVFRQKGSAGKPIPSGEAIEETNPAVIELPACDPGDTLFILVSLRRAASAFPPRSEKGWRELIQIRRHR
jgi:hypothetical protein